MEKNKLELTDQSNNTHIKINGEEIFKIKEYQLKRKGFDLELKLTTSIDEASINVVREYGKITDF